MKVINIIEESAQTIEDMVNRAIAETHNNGLVLLDIQSTGDNIFLILGEK